ncbi:NAD(P)-dependent oxidoreductase [bacterium]|nr:NAD(P)-dependent oxidoreductase [bacterium]NDC96464.1 NAD(P)-dependent oxidoreductase [bacterium]NDD86013.1 NAD(P)-dependent oxidoreductase [bacterium]
MKIAVFGSSGFVGREVVKLLRSETEHTIIEAIDSLSKSKINLLDINAIDAFLSEHKPDIIVNCAGVVDNSDIAKNNPVFTTNLIHAVVNSGLAVKRIIISGSAAEYGEVMLSDLPVDEDTPTNPQAIYGKSKLEETTKALELAKKHGLNITILRIFNPIGKNMHPKFLVSRLIDQVNEIKSGKRDVIEVNRLDAKRDYVDVRDIANAFKVIVENAPSYEVYNVGSGKAMSNAELLNEVIINSGLKVEPTIREMADKPEPVVAERADISRIVSEFGWSPKYTLSETVKGIMSNEE